MSIATSPSRLLVVPFVTVVVLASLAFAPVEARAAAPTTTYGIDQEQAADRSARVAILGGLIADGTFTALQGTWWLGTGKTSGTVAALQLVSSGLIFAYSGSLLRRDGADAAIIAVDVWTAILCTQSVYTLFGGAELVPPLDREHDLRLGAALVGSAAPGVGVTGTW
jgi:hypothetical protein